MKKYFYYLSICFAQLFFAQNVFSRPAQDQILLPPAKEEGMRILRNKNITYTNEQVEEKDAVQFVATIFTVKGRSRPDRSGKVLSQLSVGSLVKPFKWSRDKKWVAVIVKSSGVRAWLPKAALPELDEKFKVVIKDLAPSEDSAAVGTDKADE